jgi:hypothetical protein
MAKSTRHILASTALAALTLPMQAFAAVQISEIMYDPAGNDSGREWVELYNDDSDPVSMTAGTKGWKFNDGSNHLLVDPAAAQNGGGRGSLTIAPGGYVILSNDPASFLIDYPNGSFSVIKSSFSLNNSGATLILSNDAGATEDSVTYSKSEGAYDDGNSLSSQADDSFLASVPTPGLVNMSAAAAFGDATTSNAADQSSTDGSSNSEPASPVMSSSYAPPPTPQVFADAGGSRTVIVGADSEFDGRAFNRAKQPLSADTVRFLWNFGDGSTADGPAVIHHFNYPGRYAVVLEVADGFDAASSEIIVTADSADLSLAALPTGSFSIKNNSSHDVDLSRWFIADGEHQFTFPEHSIILANTSMQIPVQSIGFIGDASADLFYPNGTLAVSAGSASVPAAASRTISTLHIMRSTPVVRAAPIKSSVASDSPTNTAAVANAGLSTPLELSLAGLGGLVILGIAGVWYVQSADHGDHQNQQDRELGQEDIDRQADEYTIVSKESL